MTEVTTTEVITVTVPLRRDEAGGLRIRDTRIPLERVIYAFNQGDTPEQIVYSFDTLKLADVYAIISYYMQHREEVDDYVLKREQEADQVQREIEAQFPPDGRRERLLDRLSGQSE